MSARRMEVRMSPAARPAVSRLPLIALVLSVVALAAGGATIAAGLIQRGAALR